MGYINPTNRDATELLPSDVTWIWQGLEYCEEVCKIT
jgi:hypothetical protein